MLDYAGVSDLPDLMKPILWSIPIVDAGVVVTAAKAKFLGKP